MVEYRLRGAVLDQGGLGASLVSHFASLRRRQRADRTGLGDLLLARAYGSPQRF